MTFIEALQALFKGKTIRRASWKEGVCVFMNNGKIYAVTPEGYSYYFASFMQPLVLATDWEVIEETEE